MVKNLCQELSRDTKRKNDLIFFTKKIEGS